MKPDPGIAAVSRDEAPPAASVAAGSPDGWLRDDSIPPGDFTRLSRLIQERCGIKMPPHKKSMLETRLRKRLRKLGLDSFKAYGQYLFDPAHHDREWVQLVDVVTTNKTDFFREPLHFDFLCREALPNLLGPAGDRLQQRPLRIWSTACSTGEEPYTLAMVLAEFAAGHPGFDFSILATDISTQVLEAARTGVYREEKIEPVADALRKKYLRRSKDRSAGIVRVVPGLRARIDFRHLNLMSEEFGIEREFDLIFCRNVLIYFDFPTQQRLLQRLCSYLPMGGYLFLGHSETVNRMQLPLSQVAPTVYRRTS